MITKKSSVGEVEKQYLKKQAAVQQQEKLLR